MTFLIEQQWALFIGLEVASFIFLLLFLVIRYAFTKEKFSRLFLGLFVLCMILESLLAWLIYRETGVIDKFQIVIIIFIVYACTLGISDFKKLDRFIKKYVGKWRKEDLLTAADKRKMAEAKDPKIIARRNRRWWYIHATLFMVGHFIFWQLYGNHDHDLMYYLEDVSWFEEAGFQNAPFRGEMVNAASRLWIIIFALDTVICWSYTLFPSKKRA